MGRKQGRRRGRLSFPEGHRDPGLGPGREVAVGLEPACRDALARVTEDTLIFKGQTLP